MNILFPQVERTIQHQETAALVTVIRGPGLGQKLFVQADGKSDGTLGDAALEAVAVERALAAMARQQAERFVMTAQGVETEIFVDVYAPPPHLIVIGGVHIAIHLVAFANELGFRTTVVDARAAFATPERFPHADEIIIRWPSDALAELRLNPSTYIVALTHDPKLDDPALMVALQSPARYVGALGSKKTHAKRVESLRELGATPEQIARIHAPIGLNLGARRPEEIAVSIIAEIVAVRNEGSS